MAGYARPQYTASRIRAAGKRIVKGRGTAEDIAVLENFRASHAYVLNTFQMNARRHSAGIARTVGQRLKRRNTIVDKMAREPSMPLYAMHDIAGCRIIVETEDDLYKVRTKFRSARFQHDRLNELDRYDYIKKPKETGYRGVHDVYAYNVRKVPGSTWNGLKVEIQFRTRVQHAWATAVEVADLITSSRIKFNEAREEFKRYFQLASEVLARAHEGDTSCCSELTDSELVKEFSAADKRLGLLGTFDRLREGGRRPAAFRRNTLLIFRFDETDPDKRLEIVTFENVTRAIEEYDRLEKSYGERADIVLVRGESEENIRDAFRNYFSDARAFVDLVREGCNKLVPGTFGPRQATSDRSAEPAE